MAETSSTLGCFPAFIVALLLGFGLFVGVRQETVMPPPEVVVVPAQSESANGMESLTIIESVEAQTSAGVPASISLMVSGYQPDGCKFPVQVEQQRAGNSVTVKIYRNVPKNVMCTMELNPYNDTISLDRTFESGTYTVNVNGTVIEVKV